MELHFQVLLRAPTEKALGARKPAQNTVSEGVWSLANGIYPSMNLFFVGGVFTKSYGDIIDEG